MNRVYRVIWNSVAGCWQAVAETARAKGKSDRQKTDSSSFTGNASLSPALRLAVIGLAATGAWAAPQGGQVTAGNAIILKNGVTTTIDQSSQNAAINWQSFSVGKSEAVRFNQPNASAITLNRVTGTESSQILGSLTANGRVFILNPNGVLFGNGAQVNVGGLVASTGKMNDANFMAGNYKITDAQGSVINAGNISAASGGVVALIAPVVQSTGTIAAPQGSVLLAGAQAVTLKLQDGSLIGYTLDQGSLKALVDNGGIIQAEGGYVVLTAKGLDALSKATINHSGVIEAQTVSSKNGVVELLGDMKTGEINLSGKIDASAPKGGDGGFVETSAARLNLAEGHRVTTLSPSGKTGTWLIDPNDFTIAASGGNITGTQLSSDLGSSNVIISTATQGTAGGNGDIHVNDPVSWSANKLTLSAERNININANLNGSVAAKLALEYGQGTDYGTGADYLLAYGTKVNLPAGENFSTKQGAVGAVNGFTVITSLGAEGSVTGTDLQGINGALVKNYVLGDNLNASATASWNGNSGFGPIGSITNRFTGIFDGLGHTISGLTINRPAMSQVGLFSVPAMGSVFRNVGLLETNVTGGNYVGSLIGWSSNGTSISNSYSVGNVTGTGRVGGLVGATSSGGVIRNSHAAGDVEGSSLVGGLVGWNEASISDCYAIGNAVGSEVAIGGLVGQNLNGTISRSYAAVNVVGSDTIGGLVGGNSHGQIDRSYATGSVGGPTGRYAGGLVGFNFEGAISNSYATGDVSGVEVIGGLVGDNYGSVSNSYSIGRVTGITNYIGGLTGVSRYGNVSDSYWDVQLSGHSTSGSSGSFMTDSVGGRTTAQMQQQATYTGWDFVNTWRIVEGSSYPMLRALTQGKITLTAPARDIEKVYDKTAWHGGIIDYAGFTGGDTSSNLSGTLQWVGTAEGAVNAGSYTLIPTGLYSQKYEINYTNGTLTIQPRPVDISVTKTYNGNATFSDGFTVTNGVVDGDATPIILGTASVSSANAGNYSSFATNNLVSSNPNYTANPQYAYSGSLGQVNATIGQAAVNLIKIGGEREYDGTSYAYAKDVWLLDGVQAIDQGKVQVASGVGLLDGKNVGARHLISIGSLELGGDASRNYVLTTTGSQWTITPRSLDLYAVGDERTYDRSTYSGKIFQARGLVGDDSVTNRVQEFESKDVLGEEKSKVYIKGYLLNDGNDGKNYRITTHQALGTIFPREVSIEGGRIKDKDADGNTNAIVVDASVTPLSGDSIYLVPTSATYDSRYIGENKVVSTYWRLAGRDEKNYVLRPMFKAYVGAIKLPVSTLFAAISPAVVGFGAMAAELAVSTNADDHPVVSKIVEDASMEWASNRFEKLFEGFAKTMAFNALQKRASRMIELLNKTNIAYLTPKEMQELYAKYDMYYQQWTKEAAEIRANPPENLAVKAGVLTVLSVLENSYNAYKATSELEELIEELPFLKDKIPDSAWSDFGWNVAGDVTLGFSATLATHWIANKLAKTVVGGAIGVGIGVVTDAIPVGEASSQTIPSDPEAAAEWAKSNAEFAIRIESRCGQSPTCIESNVGGGQAGSVPFTGIWQFYQLKRDYLKNRGQQDTSQYDWVDNYRLSDDGNSMIRL